MRQLRLVGLAEDGAHVVVEAPTGDRFRLPVDERLRAACRGDLSRLGQIEIELDSTLRPKEIQARVRAGESPEQVAAAAGVPLDRVLRFAYPVVQERQRVVAQARATRVRRGGSTPAETLAELVGERLVDRGTDAATLSWDAWRREDGAWTVRLHWRGTREHSATWTFDLAARKLHAQDSAAEQLIAAEFHLRTITPVTPLAAAARGNPPGTAPPTPTPAGAGAGAPAAALPGPGTGRPGQRPGVPAQIRPTAPTAPGTPGTPTTLGAAGGSGPTPDDESGTAEPGAEAAEAGEEDERARRAHVPPWDDILLGVRRRHAP
jgi:Protein of unknown function (DUF3071)